MVDKLSSSHMSRWRPSRANSCPNTPSETLVLTPQSTYCTPHPLFLSPSLIPPISAHPTFPSPGWYRRQWRPQSQPPRWQWAGTAGTWRCYRRRFVPTSLPSRCWWSCHLLGWCQRPPLPHPCLQYPEVRKGRKTVRNWTKFMYILNSYLDLQEASELSINTRGHTSHTNPTD